MARTYKQKFYDEIDQMIERNPNAHVSDVIWALEATIEALWRALPESKKGRKVIERTKRYRVA